MYLSLTQSRSFLNILDNFGFVLLKRIISTLSRRNKPRGGSPARTTRARARCLASSDISLTSLYPCVLRTLESLIGIIILVFFILFTGKKTERVLEFWKFERPPPHYYFNISSHNLNDFFSSRSLP